MAEHSGLLGLSSADLALVIALTVLVALTVLAQHLGGIRLLGPSLFALLRGALQLALAALVVGLVLSELLWGLLAVLVMIVAAVLTAVSRLRGWRGALRTTTLAIVVASVVPVGALLLSGAYPLESRYLVALAGIVIGAAMTGATATGRRLRQDLRAERAQVEGWLALGATPRQATLALSRRAGVEAVMPAVDQASTTGLVTLPGAFVGALLAGAPVWDAGRFQLTVLVAVLAARSIVAALMIAGLGAPRLLEEEDGEAIAR